MDNRTYRHEGLKGAGMYRWGCDCCTPRKSKGRRTMKTIARRTARRADKRGLRREVGAWEEAA